MRSKLRARRKYAAERVPKTPVRAKKMTTRTTLVRSEQMRKTMVRMHIQNKNQPAAGSTTH